MVAKWCFFLDASEVEEGDVVLMGTDGIFDNLHDSEARLKWMSGRWGFVGFVLPPVDGPFFGGWGRGVHIFLGVRNHY